MSNSTPLQFDAVLANARGIGVMTGEQIEREIVRERNRANRGRTCPGGHGLSYSHAVGCFRCEFGALVRANGSVVRDCRSGEQIEREAMDAPFGHDLIG